MLFSFGTLTTRLTDTTAAEKHSLRVRRKTGARSFGKSGETAGDFPRLYSRFGAQLKNSFELPSFHESPSHDVHAAQRERDRASSTTTSVC